MKLKYGSYRALADNILSTDENRKEDIAVFDVPLPNGLQIDTFTLCLYRKSKWKKQIVGEAYIGIQALLLSTNPDEVSFFNFIKSNNLSFFSNSYRHASIQ